MSDQFTTKIEEEPEVETPASEMAMDQLLREGRYADFNQRVEEEGPADMTGANLRMTDLREANLKGASLKNAYMRACDLRGQDLSDCDLEGASLANAKVSGVLFPSNITADEITMSISHGTRMRCFHV